METRIVIEGPRGTFGAYIARPVTLPAPAVVVLHEVFGVNADIRETCTVGRRIEAELVHPTLKNPRVLARSQMRRVMNSTREQEVVVPETGLTDPLVHSLPCRRCDLELHRPLRFVLHDDGTTGYLVTMTDVADLQHDQVAASKLAIDPEVEKG